MTAASAVPGPTPGPTPGPMPGPMPGPSPAPAVPVALTEWPEPPPTAAESEADWEPGPPSPTSSGTASACGRLPPATLPESTRWGSQFIGLSGDLDPFVLRHCTFDADCYRQLDWVCLRVDSGAGAGGGASGTTTHFAVVPESHLDVRPAHYPALDVAGVVHTPEGARMLAAYVQVVHACFPVLDEPGAGDAWRRRGSVLLAAMCALGAPFARGHDAALRSRLLRYAAAALLLERRRPALETVEAALLYLQRQGAVQRAPTTPGLWADLGSLVGMSQDLGLHVDPSAWRIAPAHRHRRIRLWWAVYVWDAFCAFGMGRPPYLRDDDATVPALSVAHWASPDGAASAGAASPAAAPHAARVHFVAMAALAVLLSRLLRAAYALAAVDRLRHGPPADVEALFCSFEAALAAFRREHLEPLLSMSWAPMASAYPDCRGTVILAFHAVEIALCRAVLRLLPAQSQTYAAAREYGAQAVDAVCCLLRTLEVSRLRGYWWHPISTLHFSLVGSFMFYLLLSSTADGDIDLWSAKIREYRRLLELDDLGFDVTRLASRRMALLASVNEDSLARTPTPQAGAATFPLLGAWDRAPFALGGASAEAETGAAACVF